MTTLSVSTCFLFHELPVSKQAQLYKNQLLRAAPDPMQG